MTGALRVKNNDDDNAVFRCHTHASARRLIIKYVFYFLHSVRMIKLKIMTTAMVYFVKIMLFYSCYIGKIALVSNVLCCVKNDENQNFLYLLYLVFLFQYRRLVIESVYFLHLSEEHELAFICFLD